MFRGLSTFFLSRFFRRRRIETDLNDEIQAHLSLDTQERIERGESPQSARQAAVRGFGNPALVAEVTRDMWGFTSLEQLFQDAAYGFRVLRKAPLFTAVVVAALPLGIGSNTAGSGLGPWYLARAKALSVGLSNAYFKSLGLPSFVDA